MEWCAFVRGRASGVAAPIVTAIRQLCDWAPGAYIAGVACGLWLLQPLP
jgi:hypothetical protein